MSVIPRSTAGRRATGIASLAAVALLAACGGTPPDEAITPTDETTAPTSDQALVLWVDSVFAATLQEVVAGFEEQYGISVDVQPTEYGSIIGSYQQAVPAGSGPDLADFNIDHIGPLSDARIIAPLDFGDRLEQIDPRAVAGYTVDGEMLGLPLVLESTNVWRNTDLVPEPVTTFDQLREVALSLQAQGVEYPFVMEVNSYVFNGMITAFGGHVFRQNADGSYDPNDVGIDSEGGIAALQFLADAVSEGWLRPGVDTDTVTAAWSEGQVGIHLSGPWMLGSYGELDVPYSIDMIPDGPGGPAVPWLSARGLVVNPLSSNAALAQTFLTEYMAADEPMATFAEATGKLSAWVPVQASAASDTTQAFDAASVNGQPIPQNSELAGYWAAMDDALELIMQNQATAADVAANAAAQLRDSVAAAQG